MKKIKNSKGFTLMEMLIVVAIIAVLVAIAVPTFTTSLNKARVATDEANIRSGYASVVAELLTDENATNNTTYTLCKDGSITGGHATVTGSATYWTLGNAKKIKTGNTDKYVISGVNVDPWEAKQVVTYKVTIGDDGAMKIEINVGTASGNNAGQGGGAGQGGNG